MSQNTTVFLSYRHVERQLRERVQCRIQELAGQSVKIVTDQIAKPGDELHKQISALINECHIVVPLITASWLSSTETRDELIRAHERRKIIVCLVNADDEISHESLPFFVQEKLRLHFTEETLDAKLHELVTLIKQFRDHWKQKALSDVRKLGDIIESANDTPSYKREYIQDSLERLRREADEVIKSSTQRKRVSYEDNFLMSAIPYFRTATTICAVSIARVSTFWSDPASYEAADKYLQTQSKGQRVIRLFVFDSAGEASDFKNILQANFAAYGRKEGCGVHLTSCSFYLELLENWFHDRRQLDMHATCDFGILTYGDSEAEISLHAILDPRELAMTYVGRNSYEFTTLSTVRDSFNSFLDIDEGEFSSVHRVARWSSELYRDRELLRDRLSELFTGECANVLHIVLISAEGRLAEVRKCLNTMMEGFERDRAKYGIEELSLRERHDLFPVDGRFHGQLLVNRDFDFVFRAVFPSISALDSFYRDDTHSRRREALYIAINPNVEALYSQLNELDPAKDADNRRRISERIEQDMSKYILRVDFNLDIPVERAVQKKGIRWGKFQE